MQRKSIAPLSLVVAALACTGQPASAQPNTIDQSVYFRSDVKDDPACRGLTFDSQAQRYVWPDPVSNPAITCPDAFGWTQFLDAIRAEFWSNWAFDTFTWPQQPLALCTQGGNNCCDPDSSTNPGYGDETNPALHCPYYPGDHGGLSTVPVADRPHEVVPPVHGIIAQTDPARELRQEEAEIVYRNKPFFDYVFRNNLYNQGGLAARFSRATESVASNAPFRAEGVEIRFPADAVMFKTDWIHQDFMLELGLIQEMPSGPPNNPDAPYVTMRIENPIGDNTAGSDDSNFKPGLHYMVAITGASKALPNWHWYAFEHVGNLGRCDYIGCNDSFGFDQPAPDGFQTNYIPPKTQSDELERASTIFVTGEAYESGAMAAALDALFTATGVATAADEDPDTPSVADEAWRSYRLKGTQTTFTTSYGVATILGQSITEGGFVNTASCMTCHSQATVNGEGQPAIQSFGSSIDLNLTGYNESTRGAPDPSWFFRANTNVQEALQADFVWGIFNAQPLQESSGN